MTIPDYQSLMLPVLISAAKSERRVPELAVEIASKLGISDDESRELLASGKQRVLHNRIHWAKFYLGKAGLINAVAKGLFTASAEGKSFLATKPAKISVETLKAFPTFSAFYQPKQPPNKATMVVLETFSVPAATPEEQIDSALATIAQALKADLLQQILTRDYSFFEGLIVDLLVAMGYGGSHADAAMKIGKSHDGGIDGIIDEDRLGLDRIYVQAKRYENVTVGSPEVQGFVGSLVGRGATKGVFATTSSFSAAATAYVRHLPQRVVLIDGTRLAELMIEHGVGVRTVRSFALLKLDEAYFSDDE